MEGFVINEQLTNVRPVAEKRGAEFIVTSTVGNMKLTEAAASRLGVTAGDYLGVVGATLNGEKGTFIFKGWKTDTKTVGSKLASPTGKLMGDLVCSSVNVYNSLDGTHDKHQVYDIATEGVENGGVTYFLITFAHDEVKAAKKTKKVSETVEA